MSNFLFSVLISALVLMAGLTACAKKEGAFFAGALGLNEDRIVVATQTATALSVTSYDLDGNLVAVLADYMAEVNGPRGLALFDALNVLVSLEGDDRIDMLYLGGGSRSTYLSSSLLTGTIGRLFRHPTTDNLFVIENTNSIERFELGGTRIPQTGNAFVSGALAPCGAPASLRDLVVNSNGELVAIQSGVTAAFRYTIGPSVASACATATLAVAANDMIRHSDGNIYYAGTNSQIYRASQTLTGSTSIFNNTGAINTPTAMAELPNGDLIVASDTTDSLEIIGTNGTYKGSFLKNIYTQQVFSILVVPGQ
jgi:hypothetical protein